MGAFEDVLIKAKDLAETAGKKTSDMVELTKLKVEAAEIEKDIAATLEGLGRLIYDARKAGEDVGELIDDCVARVDELTKKKDEAEARICEFRNAVRCRNCGTVNPDDACYCKKCGEKIKE